MKKKVEKKPKSSAKRTELKDGFKLEFKRPVQLTFRFVSRKTKEKKNGA